MKAFLTLILFISFQTYAQYFDPGLLDALNVQQFLKLPVQCLVRGDIVTNQADQNKNMNACVFALCGNPSDNPGVFVTNQNYQQFLSPNIKNEIEKLSPKLNKLFAKIKKGNLQQYDEMEKLLIENGDLKINPAEWNSEFKNKLHDELFSPYIDVIVNYKKPYKERVTVKIKSSAQMSSELRSELEEYIKAAQQYYMNSSNKITELNLFSDDELKKIVEERIEKIKKVYKQKKSSLSKEKVTSIESGIELYYRNMKETNNPLIAMTSVEMLEEDAKSFMPELAANVRTPGCSDELRCMLIYRDYFKKINLIDRLKKYKSELNDPNVMERSLNHCKAQITAQANTFNDAIVAAELYNRVKTNINNKVLSRFSAHSRGILQDYLNNKIALADSQFLYQMKDPLEGFKDVLENYNNDDFIPFEMDTGAAYSKILEQALHPEHHDPYLSDGSPCRRASTYISWDSYLAGGRILETTKEANELRARMNGKDLLLISNYSCNHQLRGESIVAHEIGHAISYVFANKEISKESAKVFKDYRTCATNNYVKPEVDYTAGKIFKEDAYRTEEDTADLIAYMTYPEGKDLFSCAMIKRSHDNSAYTDLSAMASEDDPHSSFFLRLILEATNKNKTLPQSCQKAMTPYLQDLRVRKCI